MLKRRDKKTGAINFIPTAEDIEKQRNETRLSQLEKKVNQLENLIIELKSEKPDILTNAIPSIAINEEIKKEGKKKVAKKNKKEDEAN